MRVVVLFGQMGAGKSTRGRRLARRLGLRFVEGDEHLSPEFKAVAARFGMPTREVLDRAIQHLTGELLLEAAGPGPGIVVAQALYLNRYRELVRDTLTAAGHEVQLVWIKVPFWTNLRQLWYRKRRWRWALWWLLNRPWFERPKHAIVEEEDL